MAGKLVALGRIVGTDEMETRNADDDDAHLPKDGRLSERSASSPKRFAATKIASSARRRSASVTAGSPRTDESPERERCGDDPGC